MLLMMFLQKFGGGEHVNYFLQLSLLLCSFKYFNMEEIENKKF
jgi:hypothetical protein